MAAAEPRPTTLHAWPRHLHPYTRNLIRWRAQHLATAARDLHQEHEPWETTTLHRYLLYDGRTQADRATPSLSPRTITIRSHHRVWIPPANTDPFTCGLHTIDLTPGLLTDAEQLMAQQDAWAAWRTYLDSAHPPTLYRPHKRKGIVPSDEARYAGELRTAAGILGWLATRHELVRE